MNIIEFNDYKIYNYKKINIIGSRKFIFLITEDNKEILIYSNEKIKQCCADCNSKIERICSTKNIDKIFNKVFYCNKCKYKGERNPFFGKTFKPETLERIKLKNSETFKRKWKDSEYREKVIKAISKPRRQGFKQEQSIRITKWFEDNPEQRNIRSKSMHQAWEDGRIVFHSSSRNRSKFELELKEKLIEILSNNKIINKTIRIDGKWYYPDIIIDDKIIIEFYGDYWHANPKIFKSDDFAGKNTLVSIIWENDKNRIKKLESAGYKVIIVWQYDYLENKNEVIQNIKNEIENYNKI
jgi:G:T-mismatch repair DNA endonuclease (very short patch repair protein)